MTSKFTFTKGVIKVTTVVQEEVHKNDIPERVVELVAKIENISDHGRCRRKIHRATKNGATWTIYVNGHFRTVHPDRSIIY